MARVGGSFQCSALRCGGDIRPSAFKPFTSAKPSLAFALLATSDRCRLPVRVPGSIWNGPIILAVAQPPAQARGVCPPPARPRSAACSGISRCPGSRHASPPAPTDRSGKECYFHRAERPDRSFFPAEIRHSLESLSSVLRFPTPSNASRHAICRSVSVVILTRQEAALTGFRHSGGARFSSDTKRQTCDAVFHISLVLHRGRDGRSPVWSEWLLDRLGVCGR